MSKRGKVPIAEGERLSEKYDAPIVIVFSITDKGDTFNVMSYGASKALCRHAGSLAKQIADKVLGGEIVPAPEQPLDVPDRPTEWEVDLGYGAYIKSKTVLCEFAALGTISRAARAAIFLSRSLKVDVTFTWEGISHTVTDADYETVDNVVESHRIRLAEASE